MKEFQATTLNFIENDTNSEDIFKNLNNLIENTKIRENQYKLKSFLHLLSKIAQNHYQGPNFFDKILQIIHLFTNEMKKYYSNAEIFNIFKTNKRLLLFLLEEKTIIMDRYIAEMTTSYSYKYEYYFRPEIKPFKDEINKNRYQNTIIADDIILLDDDTVSKKSKIEFFEERKIAKDNDNIIEYIRKDSIRDFISYIRTNKYPLNETIYISHFDTNPFLEQKDEFSLIEYSLFFGSIQIIKYLQSEGIQLESSYWPFAVHSSKLSIIQHFEKFDKINKTLAMLIFNESIKCHHNNIAKYIHDKYLKSNALSMFGFGNVDHQILDQSLAFYNFEFIQNKLINNENAISSLCKYDYYLPLVDLLNNLNIDVNEKIIFFLINYLQSF